MGGMVEENLMELYDLFARILDSPEPSLVNRVNECLAIMIPSQPEAAVLMNQFKTFIEQTPFSRIEETYAETFSLQGPCYPYVGYHLFGDGGHRRLFLAGLEEHYQIYDFSAATKLPDHLGIMLEFLAKDQDEEERDELISLFMIPALKRMLESCEDRPTPYREMFRALLLLMKDGKKMQSEKMVPEMKEEFLSSE